MEAPKGPMKMIEHECDCPLTIGSLHLPRTCRRVGTGSGLTGTGVGLWVGFQVQGLRARVGGLYTMYLGP